MSTVRAVTNAGSWSMSTDLKQYLTCCFKKEPPASDTMAIPDASESGPDRVPCRRLSAASKGDEASDAGSKMIHLRLEADGASVNSTCTGAVDQLGAGAI